ncbi:NUDIX domain-containing protein [Fodinisporobacter ferrooxydans]|uniref:NUDIX domain-containing protein n=1 Tax=Fodinisporobacter ferrooxydans TaxID=2901836 RepID=A0ABY4CEH4_9BACL|nr:NUDIX domain-containing protein [Alicyclobacillaceae bacterium MYW30-H2]
MRKEYSAGGIVFQKINGSYDILFIRDRYGKLSLPKGHVEPGETTKEAALREVREETGMIGQIVSDVVGSVTYVFDHPGFGQIEKQVTFYLIEAVGGDLQPQLSEIRQALWLPLEDAYELQLAEGYNNNTDVLRQAIEMLKRELG